GLFLVDALLDRLGGFVDEGLGLLQAQAGRRTDDLDDLDLRLAGRGQDDVERRLLLGTPGAVTTTATAGRRSGRRDSRGRHAEPLLERLDALAELQHGDRLELVDPFLGCCHECVTSYASAVSSASPAAEASASLSSSLSFESSAAASGCSSAGASSGASSSAGASPAWARGLSVVSGGAGFSAGASVAAASAAAAGGGSPAGSSPDAFLSRTSPSAMARPPIMLPSPRTSPVSGDATSPTNWP